MESFEKILKEKIKQADFLLRQGRPSEAVSGLKEAIRFLPKESYLHYLLGMARMKCGRFFLAKKALEKANQLLPNNSENLRTLGWIKVLLAELEEGRMDLREAINLNLTNAFAYLDLAMSYIHYFEFQEGFEWLERAKALNSGDPSILENYKIAKEMEKEFSKYSKAKLARLRKRKLNPKIQRAFRISILEQFLQQGSLTEDEAQEIIEELRLNGLSGQIAVMKDRESPENKSAVEYIEWHNKVDNIEKKLTGKELKEITKKLFSKDFPLSELKTCILRLAHQGTHESLKLLKDFEKNHSGKLNTWIEMAIRECESFLKENQTGEPRIQIHKID